VQPGDILNHALQAKGVNDFRWLDVDTPEWRRMWAIMGGGCVCPDCGEDWQYMGTEYHPAPDFGRAIPREGWYHCFRHRHHPVSQQRQHIWVLAALD
jgi:hypothetical protein